MVSLLVAFSFVVRLHDAYGVPAADRHEAMRIAGKTLAAAGAQVDWAICDDEPRRRADARCAVPPAPGELIVRLLHSPPSLSTAEPPGTDTFGYAVIDRLAGRGTLATVFPDRTTEFARLGKVEAADILGRAIAHELGHLLLGGLSHEKEGLMRERWLVAEVLRNFGRDWMFSKDDATEFQRARATADVQLASDRSR
jgi:hypothetical protein